MAMHNVFFKEHEGIVHNSGNGTLPAVPRWSWLGSQPPAVAHGGQFKAAIETEKQQVGLEKGNTTHFNIFSGCKTSEDGEKSPMQTVCSVQAATMDYGPFEIGFGQALGRIMLPWSMTTNEGPIFVNAKQYSGILRRRKKRAAAELNNRIPKIRKPYMHLSRHLHALRRARGNGGRFLNTKNLNNNADKSSSTKAAKESQSSGGSEVTHGHMFSNAITPYHISNYRCKSFW